MHGMSTTPPATQATTNLGVHLLDDHDGRNPNVMPADDYRRLVSAIQRVGFLQPVLVQARANGRFTIVDGHHRVRAAKELGIEQIPCVIVEIDNELSAMLQLSMNKLRGSIDLGAAADIIATLADAGWTTPDLELSGYSDEEIDALIRTARASTDDVLENTDVAPPLEAPPPEMPADGPYSFELKFSSRKDMQRAKRALRKAAGKGNELSVGLLRLIDAE